MPSTQADAIGPEAPNRPPDHVDLSDLTQAFASANPGLQLYVEEAIAVVRARAYVDAIEQLEKLARNPNLTAAQQQAAVAALAKVRAAAASRPQSGSRPRRGAGRRGRDVRGLDTI